MAQHDYVIANANGATVRADINNALLAISSTNSGTSEPSTTYAFMLWVDTTTNLIKLRNAANGAWITLGLSITASNTVDINGGAIDGTAIGASSASTGAFTTLAATGASDLDSSVTINDTGADVDFRVESDGDTHALFVEGSSDNVGIGTDDPDYKLHVKSGDGFIAEFQSSNASDHRPVLWTNSGGTSVGSLGQDSTANLFHLKAYGNPLVFGAGADGVARMRIRSTGDVAIGTEGYDGQRLAINCGTADTIFYGESTDANCFGSFRDDSSTMDMQYGAIGNDHVFRADTTVRARITGDGLCFGTDTAAANALDDYEEGTWDPSLIGSTGSAGTWAESSWNAKYTKIGGVVFFHASGYLTNLGSYTGDTVLTGLPYSNTGSTTVVALGMFPDVDTQTKAAQTNGATTIGFFEGAKTDASHPYSQIVTGYYCNVSGHYLTW